MIIDETKKQAQEIFEGCAEHYASERGSLPCFRAQVDLVLEMLSGVRGRVLDIGCAAGEEIVDLRAQGFSVVGMDLTQRMLQFARSRFANDSQVNFCCADVERLPFASASMDHIVCLGVFEFIPDYAAAVSEMHRVLQPGGLAVFAIPSGISLYAIGERVARVAVRPLWRVAKRMLGRKVIHGKESFHRNLCVPWCFRSLLRGHGFEPLQSRYSNYFLYPLEYIPKLDAKVAELLEPAAALPLLRYGASVYLVSARKQSGSI
jgi:ubiquinone/menaquinone biosynthesis C-methylase UbiE